MAVELRRSLSTPGDVNAGSSNRRTAASGAKSSSQQGHGQLPQLEHEHESENRKELTSTASLPPLKPDLDLSDRTLFAVYCFFKNFIGTAGSSNAVAIDNKIEQAMDLVKSHLMFAVREEVEVLKEKISELMDKINQLEIENSILKANASQETLAQLPTHTSTPSTAVSNTTNNTQASIGPTNSQPP